MKKKKIRIPGLGDFSESGSDEEGRKVWNYEIVPKLYGARHIELPKSNNHMLNKFKVDDDMQKKKEGN